MRTISEMYRRSGEHHININVLNVDSIGMEREKNVLCTAVIGTGMGILLPVNYSILKMICRKDR